MSESIYCGTEKRGNVREINKSDVTYNLIWNLEEKLEEISEVKINQADKHG